MIVLLDIDGVVCDLASYLCDWLHAQGYARRTPDDIRQFDFAAALDVPRATIDRFWAEVGVEQHGLRLPAYPGARRFVDALRRKHRVVACTASAGAEWTGQRAMWLATVLGFAASDVVFAEGELKARIVADVLIDDRVETCGAFADRNGWALLFDRPWNRGFEQVGVNRVDGYAHVLSALGCE